MSIKKRSVTFALVFAAVSLISASALAQRGPAVPRQEKLLNGLKVLMFQDPAAKAVTARLRVHSGSAFDPQEKEGVMRMLAEAIFPNEAARDFFREDLGGELKIESNYDHIQITASARPEEMVSMLETLANAVTNPTIDKDTTDAVRASVMRSLEAFEKDTGYAADREVAARLLGTFPYGRPQSGTQESLGNIDFADIRFAYDRFFGADNATLALSGNFDPNSTFRAVRRLFGSWLKSDRRVPPTFKQPDAPPAEYKMIPSLEDGTGKLRYAVRGFARSDADLPASLVLTRIYEARLRAKFPADRPDGVFVRNQAHILPGLIVFGLPEPGAAAVAAERYSANAVIGKVLSEKITDAEFASARASVLAEYNATEPAERWLDIDTYRISSVKSDQAAFASVSLADVQRVADKIKAAPIATVVAVPPAVAEQK